MVSIVSEAPTPHSPPIATPYRARSTISTVRLGAKPEANSRIEYKQDIDHQGRPAAPAVGGAAENEGADRPHRQRQQDGERDVGDIGVEFRGDVLEHEDQQEEIEGVQRPSEKARRHHVFLFAGPAGQCCNGHLFCLEGDA